jgi:hypothetical protein
MTTKELQNIVIENLPIKEIHPLHKAILDECCESVIKNSAILDVEMQIHCVNISFIASFNTLKGVIKGALESTDSDVVTLNYREQQFLISKNSSLLT